MCRQRCSLIALTLMLLATARPVATVTLPTQQETIILAMDVSGSMRAADVHPNRLQAAQGGGQGLRRRVAVADQGRHRGLRCDGRRSYKRLPSSHEDMEAAHRPFSTAARNRHRERTHRRAGDPVSPTPASTSASSFTGVADRTRATRPIGQSGKPKEEFKPVAPGSNGSAAIILLTDGQRTTGPDALQAAQMVADRGVRVYTVGVGTKEGETIGFEGWSMRVRLDEESLKRIAEMTQGEYFLRGYRGRPEENLPVAQRPHRLREKTDRDRRPVCGAGGLAGHRSGAAVAVVVRARTVVLKMRFILKTSGQTTENTEKYLKFRLHLAGELLAQSNALFFPSVFSVLSVC